MQRDTEVGEKRMNRKRNKDENGRNGLFFL